MQSIERVDSKKVIIGMVGLPARGKSYISKKIYRYLNWLGFPTEVFNIGNYRRKYLSGIEIKGNLENNINLTLDFFDPQNEQALKLRQQIADEAISDLIQYISREENKGAILDGTNCSINRRNHVKKRFQEEVKEPYELIWVQSICTDEAIINDNINQVKAHGKDYINVPKENAIHDFKERIRLYQKYYQTVGKQEGSYVKTIDVGKGLQAHQIKGYLAQKIMSYTMNLTISPKRIIYLSRHGQSMYNTENRIGGNPGLSPSGCNYAKAIPKIFDFVLPSEEKENIVILTSTLRRTINTVEGLKSLKFNNVEPIQVRILDQLNAGICEDMTYEEIAEKYPEISAARNKDKLRFRYPNGESYLDVIGRLDPLVCWIERQHHPIAIFGHQAILRCLSAYFYSVELELIPYIDIPLHTIIRMTPETYTFRQEYISVDIETGQVKDIERVAKKKYSIDQDGSKRHIK